jgi:hypothetical protein
MYGQPLWLPKINRYNLPFPEANKKMNDRIKNDLEQFKKIIEENENIAEILCKKSPHKEAVALLQRLLNDLGYGDYLNWNIYKDDGNYGSGTQEAINAFIKDITSEGTCLPDIIGAAIAQKIETLLVSLVKSEAGEGLTIKESSEGKRPKVYISFGDISVNFTKFKKGVYNFGKQKPATIITDKKDEIKSLGLTDSEINIIMAVSENEGNLDAVNTWDNSFLSFGMFQWTTGSGKQSGELPALLKRIKEKDELVFEKYYGKYGLDIKSGTNKLSGYFTLEGKETISPIDKNRFRNNEWAFYFWLSGQDPLVQLMQVQHAVSRMKLFYNSDNYKVKDYYISDLITSEYGAALILDNHVNRPGYIKSCLEQALDTIELTEPNLWKTEDELKLIDAYLEIRKTYGLHPMTHAKERAERIGKYRDDSILSDRRGTFKTAINKRVNKDFL